ncbi:hypothetical protein D9M68_20000 [compost metagenome]
MKNRKGVYLRVIGYDDKFNRLQHPAILMNDFNIDLEADRAKLNNLIYASLDGDSLSSSASCDCGEITGMDNYGIRCKECLSLVTPITEKPMESLLWLRVPTGIKSFINLTVWRILSKNLTHSNFNILEHLCNPRYIPPNNLPADKLRKLERLEITRGYNNFVDNYEAIITGLFKAGLVGPSASARRRKKILRFLQENLDRTFSQYLPFPTRLSFIKESANNRITADPKMVDAVNAAHILIGVDNRETSDSQLPLALPLKEARVVSALQSFDSYYKTFEADIIFRKPGVARKLIYGTRPYWGFRGVITSRQKPHRQDAIEMPWSLSVLLFKVHLQNKLLPQGYTPNEMQAMIYENTLRWHPELDRLFKELLAESPNGTIPTIFGRNPTLTRGSVGYNQIDNIKFDPTDNTISMSPLNLIDKNADFDGDALWGELPLDNKNAKVMSRHDPVTGVMDLNKPFSVSRNTTLPAPLIASITNWIIEGDQLSV